MTKKITGLLNNTSVMALALAVVLFFVMSIFRPSAFSLTSFATILANASLLLFVSAAQMVEITSGDGIDLSVGAMMSTTACLTVEIMNGNHSMLIPVVLICMAFGFFVGMLNGLGIAYIKIPALIMTLGMANVLTKFQPIFSGSAPRGQVSQKLADSLAARLFGVIPGFFVVAAIFYIIVVYFLTHTQFGMRLNLVGTNFEAARLSGINARRIRMLAYAFGGMMAGLGGVMGAGYFKQMQIATFDGYTMQSIAAVVIGGTMLSGGKPSYFGTFSGTVMLVTLSLFLSTINTAVPMRNIVMGAMLIGLLIIYNRKPTVRQ
jgi:ribose transport system permease protein